MVRRLTSPVLVGRSEVVGQLEAVLEAARDGRPRHAVIGGEAGVGKTRLLAETRERAQGGGARVLLGGCVPVGAEGLPFAPYTEIIRALVAEDGGASVIALAGRAAPDLARLVPALDTGGAAREPELWAQTRLYEALLDLFRRLAERGPLVLQIEDLHWADAGTLAATSFLLRAIESEPITIMAAFRADEVTRKHPVRPWLAEVVRDADVERVELEPLGQDDVPALIGAILGEELQDREVADIHQRSDGNPFFVEELLCCRTDYVESLPASLRDVLLSRIDALPDASQELVGVAAVGGREVEHEMLLAIADVSSARDLRSLVDVGLLVPSRAPDGDDAYAFRHALLREVIYEELLPTERRRLHQRWGQYLEDHEQDGTADPAGLLQLAHHWREARDLRALAASIAAGDAAMASFSYDIASREFGEALALWEDSEPERLDLDQVALLERAARAAYLSSENRRAVAWCREALDELDEADPARRTALLILLGRSLWVSGDWGASIDIYEQALDTSPAEPPIVRIQALAGLAQVYMLHARYREARPMLEAAIESAIAVGARDLEGHARNTLGVVLAGLGDTTTALESLEDALAIALELGIPDDIGRAYINKSETEAWCGYPERAIDTVLEGLRVTAEWGVANSYGAPLAYGAVSFAFECGRWDEALDFLSVGDRVAGSANEGTYVYRASYAMEVLACRGDERFEPLWEHASKLILQRPPSDNHGLMFQGGIEHAAMAGDHAQALAAALQAVEVLQTVDAPQRLAEVARVGAWPAADLGRSARLRGDAEALTEARADMDRLRESATVWQGLAADLDSQLAKVLRLGAHDEVEAQRARMEGSDTFEQWKGVADGWVDLGRPFRATLARWWAAESAESAGDREVAASALREAYRGASDLGAAPLLTALETMARRLRVRLGGTGSAPAAPERAYGLTKRELEVLGEVAAGRTNREIAENLFISESTAGVHVSNILGKLGVSTRTEAARVALDQGLVGDSSD